MRMGNHSMMPRDKEAVKDLKLANDTSRRVWAFARPYRVTIIIFLLSILGAALLAIVPPLVVREILDDAIPTKNKSAIWWLAGIAVAAAMLDALLQIVQRWTSARVGESLIADLRRSLYEKVQRLPLAFFTRTPTGAITSRLNNDVVGAQTAVTSTLGSVVSNVIVLATTLTTMALLEWRLTLLSLFVLPMFVIPARRVGRRLQTISREQMQHNAAMNTQMTERFNVSGAALVKLFGSLDRESRMFGDRANAVRDAGIRAAMLGRVFFVALGLVAAVGTAAIYGIGALMVVEEDISTGTLVALAALVTRIYQPLTGLTNARVDLMTSMVSFERVFEVLDAPEPISDKPSAFDLIAPRGEVEFRDVMFRYPAAHESAISSMEIQSIPGADPDVDVLTGLSLTLEAGETVALVGASGAGKSTIASLIPRLYDVTNGTVLIDGHDIRDLTLTSLRQSIGVVSQDPHLFHESIGDNLRYARPDATDDEIVEACKAARIHETIASLPDGFDTVVGERGYRLSGGEKQRVAIARLLLKNPAVVILDEATSHLDNDNEAHVQASIDTALRGRTALVIAHRLSTIRSADRIAFLDGGRIVEIGTHDDLVSANGLYASQLRAGDLLTSD
jgi:ATP-binding cassette subfamily B protein